jgi:hypothetical protein
VLCTGIRYGRHVIPSRLLTLAATALLASACSHRDEAKSAPDAAPPAPIDAAPLPSDASEDASSAEDATPATTACPAGMLLVDGDFCTDVEQKCLKEWYAKWNDKHICMEFQAPSKCIGKKEHRRYCIDKYEYPNREGVRPTVMNDFYMAQPLCAEQGKRMCTETEWVMACEGPEYKPYPYGYVRDPTICRGDQSGVEPLEDGFEMRDGKRIAFFKFASKDKAVRVAELERLWQGVPSGSQPKCVSDYGVYDMPGNADELAASETPPPVSHFDNVTIGGPWRLGVRNQCRPRIYTHNEGFGYYYLSFRCCAEADGKASDPRAPKQIARKEPWKGGKAPIRDSWDGDPFPDPRPAKP